MGIPKMTEVKNSIIYYCYFSRKSFWFNVFVIFTDNTVPQTDTGGQI